MARSERGFTLIELLIVVAIISIIAAIAVPGLLQSKMTANEASALASMRTTSAAQVSYSTVCGMGGYATSFPVLYTPTPGTSQGFISADLGLQAAPIKSGFLFGMSGSTGAMAGPADCNGTATLSGFYATAVPLTFGTSGARSFAVTAANTIWEIRAATAPTEPFGAPASPVH